MSPQSHLSSVRRHALAAQVVPALMSVAVAHAAPVLRVQASSHFVELRATFQEDGRVEVQGTLQDDLNQPIANAVVTVPNELGPRACDSSSAITTDHQGKFCANLDSRGRSTRVAFQGDGLVSETSAVVETQTPSRPPLTVALDTPLEWSRSASQHVVTLTINSEQDVFALVSLRREGVAPIALARAPFAGGRAVVEIPTPLLPPAGPLNVHAEVVSAHNEPLATGDLGIDVVSVVQLALQDPPTIETRTGEELSLHFLLQGDPPLVDSGWVELKADGANVAMVPVSGGKADATVALRAARQRGVQMTATFVPQSQYHLASEPITWSVTVLGPRHWLHLPLAALLLGVALRILKAWRRPSRESGRVTSGLVTGTAQLLRHELPVPLDGWQGVVVDAHTGAPIAGATVALVVPTLAPGPPARQATTGDDGTFRFDKLTPLPEGSRLLVRALQHSSLENLAPQPGLLDIALVARRRTLLAAVKDWAAAATIPSHPDPTPRELAYQAQTEGDETSADWIRLVDEAVYGPDPVLSTTEDALLGRRPARVQRSAKGR
jgi:hypothetical protein